MTEDPVKAGDSFYRVTMSDGRRKFVHAGSEAEAMRKAEHSDVLCQCKATEAKVLL